MGTLVTVRSPFTAARASRITTLPRSTRASAAPRCVGAPEKMVTRGGRLNHGDRVGVVTARVIPSAGSRTAGAWRDRNAVISRATPSGGSDEADNAYFDEDDTGKLLVACAIGLATGLGVALFNVAEHSTHDAVFIFSAFDPSRFQLEGERQSGPAADTLFQAVSAVAAPTAAGFLVTGLRFAAGGFEGEEVPRAPRWRGLRARSPEDEDEGKGVVDVDTDADAEDTEDEDEGEAPGLEGPLRRAFKPVLKAAAAVVTLGSGASLGPEGPSVEIGASVAGGVSELANMTSSAKTAQRLGLIAAGSAAGISAGFGAPIAGLFFAFESILQPAASRGSLPTRGGSTGFGPLTTESVILASVLAAVVSNQILGDTPAFVVPAFDIRDAAELPLYLPLGFLCGATAVAFRASSSALGNAFNALEKGVGSWGGVPREWHAPLGGLIFGFIALYFPEVTYQGFDNVNSILNAEGSAYRLPYPPELLLELVLVKIASTSLCRQSGLVGGVYAPSLFMGAALGSAYGAALVPLALAGVPVAAPQAYALVGMAGVLAGICRVPLTAILLLFELTHDYRIIVPLMGTVGVSSLVASAAERKMSMMSASVAQGTKSALDSLRASFDEDDELDRVSREAALERAMLDDELECAEEDEEIGLCEITAAGSGTGSIEVTGRMNATDEEALRSLRVADVIRRDVPRVSALASAADAAREACDYATIAREKSNNSVATCCAVVVDPASGEFVGVATASSLAGALDVMRTRAKGNEGLGPVSAADACDFSIPSVKSGSSLWEARTAMASAGGAGLCAVVAAAGSNARGVSVSQSDGDGFAVGVRALGVVAAGDVESEREAARLRKSLKLLRRQTSGRDSDVTDSTGDAGKDEVGGDDSDAGEEAKESRSRNKGAVRWRRLNQPRVRTPQARLEFYVRVTPRVVHRRRRDRFN